MNLYIFKGVGLYFGGAVGIVAESENDALDLAAEAVERNKTLPYGACEFTSDIFVISPKAQQILDRLAIVDEFGHLEEEKDDVVTEIIADGKHHYSAWVLMHTVPVLGAARGILFEEWHDG